MADLWTQPSDTKLADLTENVTVAVDLPLSDTNSTVKLISGKLPGGIRILGSQLVGTPYEVARVTDFRFVLRAELNGAIKDRTFKLTVSGPDAPVWQTDPGLLPVGNNDTFYILDSSPVDFQLIATDDDIEAGQTLSYFIADGDGELPPGIELTEDGRIVGIVDPILAIEKTLSYNAGTFDTAPYDFESAGYDFGLRSSNGFDSFYYDTTIYDFKYNERTPKKLNRYYQFTISVTDGDIVSRRTFRIFVVGDDFFRVDNTIMQVGTGTFTADNTNLRVPIWLTPSDLGVRRANNYITLFLDIIDPNTLTGVVSYELLETTPGTYRFTDGKTAEGRWDISGEFPIHPDKGLQNPRSAEKMVTGFQYIITKIGTTDFTNFGADTNSVGTIFTATGHPVSFNENIGYVRLIDFTTVVPETKSTLPVGLELDTSTGEIAGVTPYQSEITTSYKFSVRANRFTPDQEYETASTEKTFTLKLLGEIDSETTWITDSNLGLIGSNVISVLKVEATTSIPNSNVIYSLNSGRLPPGLALSFDGEIVGKVNAFGQQVYKSFWKPTRSYTIGDVVRYEDLTYRALTTHTSSSTFNADSSLWERFVYTENGLTVFDGDTFTLDGATTPIDREYKFVVSAQDLYKYNIVNKEFSIRVENPDTKRYSNLYMKPFLKENVRQSFRAFISDPEIFIPELIYRPSDPNFGIQKEIKMLVYAGIESTDIQNFVAAASKNHKRKRYLVGDLKTAVAKVPGSNDIVYEVVYLDVVDPAEPSKGKTAKTFNLSNADEILVNTVNATPKNTLYDFEDKPTFSIQLRSGNTINVTLGDDFEVVTRNGDIDIKWEEGILVDRRTEDTLIEIIRGLGPTSSLRPARANSVKTSSTHINASQNKDVVKFISNLTNMRENIRPIGATERDFVPLWMRSAQENNVNELGFTPALILCYTKPGQSEVIKSAIKSTNFDFSQFDLDLDRYIIDSTKESSAEEYILFANYQFNV